MSQTRDSGAAGNDFGRSFAPRLANVLGARMVRTGSNECVYQNEHMVLKSARGRTRSIGVSYRMLDGLNAILAAFQDPEGAWRVFRVDAAEYRRSMRPTGSRGPSAGRVGVLDLNTIVRVGTLIGTFSVS
jgi:hypothetical protein